MGFLQRLLAKVFRYAPPEQHMSSFDHLSEEELEAHLSVVRYGDFALTDAVRLLMTYRSCLVRVSVTMFIVIRKTTPPCRC